MAHICPNCFEHAPLIFSKCPDCDFDMSFCNTTDCGHCYTTRNRMIRDKNKGLDVSKIRYDDIYA